MAIAPMIAGCRARSKPAIIRAMTIDDLTARIRERAAQNPPLGYRVKFDLGPEGVISWDGTGDAPAIGNADEEADTTIGISAEDLEKMLSGELNPTIGYMTGRLKISGSMGVALKISQLLEG
jgi:putative sterol carrier protein